MRHIADADLLLPLLAEGHAIRDVLLKLQLSRIGQHTVEVLRAAGIAAAEIERLLRAGVIVQADVARGVAYMASLSLEANVQFMTVMATKMPISVVADASQHCMSSMLTPSGAAT